MRPSEGIYNVNDYFPRVIGDGVCCGGEEGTFLCLVQRSEDADCPDKWQENLSTLSPNGDGCYEAFICETFMNDDEDWEDAHHYFSIEEVRHYIRMALDNIALKAPDQAEEVRAFIQRYGL